MLYRLALGTVVAARFSVGEVGADFVRLIVGGIALGVAVGWVGARVRLYASDARNASVVSLVTPFTAWVLAAGLHDHRSAAVGDDGSASVMKRAPRGEPHWRF